MIKVQNVNGSSRFESPVGYNTWLEYWEAKTGKSAWRCSAIDCHKSGVSTQLLPTPYKKGLESH